MVSNTGAAHGIDSLRTLNSPRRLQVQSDEKGEPQAVYSGRGWRAVEQVLDRWLIDDEWWRENPIHRAYYEVDLEGDVRLVLFHDLVDGAWHTQRA